VVAGSVNRFRGHGGIGFTRAVRAWRAQATDVGDRGCGLVRTATGRRQGESPLAVFVTLLPLPPLSVFRLDEAGERERMRGMTPWGQLSAM
jgi:hypothetical protein